MTCKARSSLSGYVYCDRCQSLQQERDFECQQPPAPLWVSVVVLVVMLLAMLSPLLLPLLPG